MLFAFDIFISTVICAAYLNCIMVNDDCNVLMPLFVAGLINADVYEIIKHSGALGFDVIEGSVNTSLNCFPVDAHVLY